MLFAFQNMNRASLKVDVSYTDHGHMIGVGGKCSKDLSNRTSQWDGSVVLNTGAWESAVALRDFFDDLLIIS